MKAIVAVLFVASCLRAGGADAGRPAAQLRQGFGARALAMGRAYGAEQGDAYAFLYNPAASAGLEHVALGLQQAYVPVEREAQYAGFARPVGGPGGDLFYGAGATRLSLAKPIERRTGNTPEPLYTFGETRYSAHLAACGWVAPRRLSLGAGFHYLYHQLGDAQGSGYGFDLGARYGPLDWFDVGVAVQDVIGRMTWTTGMVEELPLGTRESVSVRPGGGWVLVGELAQVWGNGVDLRYRAGAEWKVWGERLAFRLGFDTGNTALGLGFRTPFAGGSIALDYALATEDGAAGWLQHRVSLGFDVPLEAEAGAQAQAQALGGPS